MSNITILRYAYKTITGSINFNIIGHLGVGTLSLSKPNPTPLSHFSISITVRGWPHRLVQTPSVGTFNCDSVKSSGPTSISQHSPIDSTTETGRKVWCDWGMSPPPPFLLFMVHSDFTFFVVMMFLLCEMVDKVMPHGDSVRWNFILKTTQQMEVSTHKPLLMRG